VIFSVYFDKVLFVSVVSIPVWNTETNWSKVKKVFFGFTKQTKKQLKQIEFRFVSVRTEKKIDCFEDTLLMFPFLLLHLYQGKTRLMPPSRSPSASTVYQGKSSLMSPSLSLSTFIIMMTASCHLYPLAPHLYLGEKTASRQALFLMHSASVSRWEQVHTRQSPPPLILNLYQGEDSLLCPLHDRVIMTNLCWCIFCSQIIFWFLNRRRILQYSYLL
jgi:hypothetical protein